MYGRGGNQSRQVVSAQLVPVVENLFLKYRYFGGESQHTRHHRCVPNEECVISVPSSTPNNSLLTIDKQC